MPTQGKNDDVFDLYKLFRNYTSKLNVTDSLLAIHSHMQFQQSQQILPGYIQGTPEGYRDCKRFSDFIQFHLFPWQLALLAKEIIIYGQLFGSRRSLLHWYDLSNSVNRLKDLEDGVLKIYTDRSNVLSEIHRITHRQFRWQNPPNSITLTRYLMIYREPELSRIIEATLGMSIEKIYLIGFALTGFYLDKFALNYPPKIEIENLSSEELDNFVDRFSITFDDLKEKLKSEQEYNEKFAYAYNSLSTYPLIRMEYGGKDSLVCPVPRYLFDRFTLGLYYEICNQNNFDHAFGDSFQAYIGKVLKAVHPSSNVFPEQIYNKNLRTIDWILHDKSAALFIECKTKRLTLGAKVELDSDISLDNQLGKIADFIIQIYKTILEWTKGKYPHYKYDKNKKIYPLVVTLEDWYLFGDKSLSILDNKLSEQFKELNLPMELLIKYPYSVCSTESFEKLVQIVNRVGIDKVMKGKTDKEAHYWEMLTYLQANFRTEINETKDLFSAELDEYLANFKVRRS